MKLFADDEPTSADHDPNVLYDIGKSDTVGRFMVAKRDIRPGEVIFQDSPAVIGPDNSSVPMCTVCWRKVTGEYVCEGCGWPLCGPGCRDTENHRQECKFFQQRRSKVKISCFGVPNSLYDALLPLRVLTLKLSNPRIFSLVCLLMDHQGDEQTESRRRRHKRIADIIRNTWRFGADFTEEEVIRILGILSVNSFCVHDGVEDGTGLIGLYPWTSLMSHCCVPNIKIITKPDFSYVCEALVDIPQGTEIVTSYHHYYYHLFGSANRRKHIRNNWKFDCICTRCKDPTELNTFVNAVKCDKCGVGAVMLPLHSLDYNSDWKCQNCQNLQTSDKMDTFLQGIENKIEAVPYSNPEILEQILEEISELLHENHYLITDTKRRLIDIYGVEDNFQYNNLERDKIESKVRHCDHLLRLCGQLSPGKSEMRAYLLFNKFGASQHLMHRDMQAGQCNKEEEGRRLSKLISILDDVVEIFGPIRTDSHEGEMGMKADNELKLLQKRKELLL